MCKLPLLLSWLHFKSSATHCYFQLRATKFMVRNFTQQSQNFLAVTKAKSSKTCLLPIALIALSQDKIIMNVRKDFILRHNIQSEPAMWYSWLSMRQQSWVGLARFPVGSHRRRDLAACPSILVLGIDGWMQENVSCACYHWLTTSAAITAKAVSWPTVEESKDGRLQTNRDTPEGVQKPSINETGLSSPFNRKSQVIDQDFPNSTRTLIIFSYLMENVGCFVDRQNIYTYQ